MQVVLTPTEHPCKLCGSKLWVLPFLRDGRPVGFCSECVKLHRVVLQPGLQVVKGDASVHGPQGQVAS